MNEATIRPHGSEHTVASTARPPLACARAVSELSPPGAPRGADGLGRARSTYVRRRAEDTVLHYVVREHLETFLAEARLRGDGTGLPRFVERELREFLSCGVLARGFARFRCTDCGRELLVAFSCKGRGFCPSCCGRRMAELAAHLVDGVLGGLPVRQWVLTLPYRLRYALAWDHRLCRAVLAVFIRAVLRFERRRAERRGMFGGSAGAVTAIQRFGSALNTNVHFHTLVAQGVFVEGAEGSRRFVPLPAPTDREVTCLLATVRRRIVRLVARHGINLEDPSGEAQATDPLGIVDFGLPIADSVGSGTVRLALTEVQRSMTKDELKRRTQRFALAVIQLVDSLPRTRTTEVVGRQLLRSGTSVGANYRAACRARSPADFVSKMGIVEEEADESMYWMELLVESGAISAEKVDALLQEANELLAITVSSIKTARMAKDRAG